MATAVPDLVACLVNTSNVVYENGNSGAGTAVRNSVANVHVVDSSNNIIDTSGTVTSITRIPQSTVVVVDSANKVLASSGTAGTEVRQMQVALRVVDSTVPAAMAVRLVSADNTILDALYGASTAGEPIGLLLALTKAA